MNNRTIRVSLSDPENPVYSRVQRLEVKGWTSPEVGGLPPEQYAADYANVGEVLLQVVGKVEEQETFEERVVPGFIVGEWYQDSNGITKKCAFKVEGKQQWGFEYTRGYNIIDSFGISTIVGMTNVRPATQRVSLGKKKVLVPVT